MIMRQAAAIVSILPLLLAPDPAAAETELRAEAVALLRASISAHSKGPAKLRLTYGGAGVFPDQSASPEGPFAAHPWNVSLAIDEGDNAIAYDSGVSIDGDFFFRTEYGFAAGEGFSTTYTGEYEDLPAFPAVANVFLPHRLLKSVLETAKVAAVDSVGPHNRLTYGPESGPLQTLLFDQETDLLVAVRRPPAPSVYGDQIRETIYGDYRRIGGTMVPGSVTTRTANPVLGASEIKRRLVEFSESGPTTAELTLPAGAVKRKVPQREFAVESLGRDVYLLSNVGVEGQFVYNVLAVLFEDHILIVEAALNDATSRKAIAAVEKLAPGKPIRTLVQTHHHADHIGGIRTYIANGTKIIAPAGTHDLFQRIAATHSAVEPDALAQSPRPAIVEEVQGERVIRDKGNEVRVYDVANDHSAHMLVAYLPEQGVLYQGDLVSAGELSINATSRRFLAWLDERGMPVTKLAGVHGRTLAGEELQTLLREGRLAPASADAHEEIR